jgi:phage FluMu protein gp41
MATAKTKKKGPTHTVQTVDGKLVLTDKLLHGLNLDGVRHSEFDLREAITEDLFEAERLSPAHNALAFDAQMICRQLVRIGTYTGPFTIEIIGKLKTVDFALLREKALELEILGKPELNASVA